MPSCLREAPSVIDVDRARRQHAGYVDALRKAGIAVRVLPAADDLPDSCFVEDAAIVLGADVVMTRPGAPERRGEVGSVAAALSSVADNLVADDATLDGGDVLRVGPWLFIGLSQRTNSAGAAWLSEHASRREVEAVTVTMRAGLHLKSAVTALDHQTVVLWPGAFDPAVFRSRGIDCIETAEAAGANVLALGHTIIASAAAPQTNAQLASAGHQVIALEVDEFHKADGALTCLSLRFPASRKWCA